MDDHRKKDHKGADIQGGEKGALHRTGKGDGEALGLKLGGGRALFPAISIFSGLVKAEHQPHAHRRQGVGQVEKHPHRAAGKDPRAHHSQDEGGAGIVAEGQQPLRLGAGTHPLFIEADGGLGPHRVAPHKAQGEGGGAGPADVEQGAHDPLQQPPQVAGQAQLHHQGGEHEKGKERRDDHVVAQLEAGAGRLHGRLGVEHQRQCGAQQDKAQNEIADSGLGQQPGHGTHLLHRWVCAAASKIACPPQPVRNTWLNRV